jgi:hypothetical protein
LIETGRRQKRPALFWEAQSVRFLIGRPFRWRARLFVARSSVTRKGRSQEPRERKAGHLATADRGTLFLDELGEITAATQVKLLRFLQDRSFVPVGSTQARAVDVRIISATNRDLAKAVGTGAFREDFYYRLNVFAIEVASLRERPEDILPLADRFLGSTSTPSSASCYAQRSSEPEATNRPPPACWGSRGAGSIRASKASTSPPRARTIRRLFGRR